MSNQNFPLVYFFAKSNFGDTNPDFIKIGYTGTELSLRKAALQTGCESLIWAMGVLPFEAEDEARREERRIHEHFGGFRARGEWFYATPRIIQYIEDYAVQYTELFIEDVPTDLKWRSYRTRLIAYPLAKKPLHSESGLGSVGTGTNLI